MAQDAPRTEDELLDCVIVGCGPAGLTALLYLARFHRRAVALGAAGSRPRLMLIERTYNLPGYPEGVQGAVILRRLREQAEEMGGEVYGSVATRVEGQDGDFTVHLNDAPPLRARKIVLAMGVRDIEPDGISNLCTHVGHFVRYCPVCDGYEHTGKALGIMGSGPNVARHALFLETFSNCITVFLNGEKKESLKEFAATLAGKGIEVESKRIVRILEEEDADGAGCRGIGVALEDGSEYPLEALYVSLGCSVNLDPVRDLELKLDDEGFVVTDQCQQTSIPGIYAAGDLVSQISQISVAFGQAAIAAVKLHNALDE